MINCLEKYIWQGRRLREWHALTEQKANYGQCECTTKFARRKISLSTWEKNWIKNILEDTVRKILGWHRLLKTLHMQTPIISLGCVNICYVPFNCQIHSTENKWPGSIICQTDHPIKWHFPSKKYKLLSPSWPKDECEI